MKTKLFTLAIAFNVFAVTPMWAQQKSPDANLLAQLEKRLAESASRRSNSAIVMPDSNASRNRIHDACRMTNGGLRFENP